ASIGSLKKALMEAAIVVALVLIVFLMDARATLVSLAAIPISILMTMVVFQVLGMTINTMTLGGLAIAIGELVDDAVVDVENILRRLNENRARANPRPVLQVIASASQEVRSGVLYATIIIVLVFLPLFALSGIEGRLFAPLGIAYIVSILASLLVSLTVTPVLSYYLLPQARATHARQDSPLLRALKWSAGYLVRLSMARAGMLLVLTWVLVGVSFWVLTGLGVDFLPAFDEGSVQVGVSLPAGSSLEASNEVAAVVDRVFRSMQRTEQNPKGEILQFVRRTGRAEL